LYFFTCNDSEYPNGPSAWIRISTISRGSMPVTTPDPSNRSRVAPDPGQNAKLKQKRPRPCRIRQCFGTSSQHWGQAGWFRLPVKACRPQPPLCVPESFVLTVRARSRWPRTGQGKFKFKPSKERDCLPQHPCQYQVSSRRKLEKQPQGVWGLGRCPRTRHRRRLADGRCSGRANGRP
jgi:hypothetical protein